MGKIERGIEYARHYGAGRLARKVLEHGERKRAEAGYEEWLSAALPPIKKLVLQREEICREEERGAVLPVFSLVVPVYRTPEPFLRAMVESVLDQSYGRLELCIADASPAEAGGGSARPEGRGRAAGEGETQTPEKILRGYMEKDRRIRYVRLERNLGIAGNTNAALELASGDFICLLDHDDLLAPNALYELYQAWRKEPRTDMFYSDEDKVDAEGKRHFTPHFKPDFNRELLRSNNYICHLFCVRRTLALQAGGLREGFDGAQDHDFILRCTELSERICHIPKVLYHWRTHQASTAMNPGSKGYACEAGRRAVAAHLHRMGEEGQVIPLADPGFYRVRYQLTDAPDVTMIVQGIFSRVQREHFLEKIRSLTDYPRLTLMQAASRQEAAGMLAAEAAREKPSGLLLFLDRDTLPAHRDWLRELASFAVKRDAGCVGPRIYGPSNRLKSAGEVTGMFGRPSACPFEGLHSGFYGYMHKVGLQQECSVVSGSCLLVRRDRLLEALAAQPGLLEGENWHVALCLAMRERGLRNFYTPFAVMKSSEPVRGGRASLEEHRGRSGRGGLAGAPGKTDPFYHPELSVRRGRWLLKNITE